MLTLCHEQIDAIRLSKELCSAVADRLSDPTLSSRPAKDLSDSDYEQLHDACIDALTNNAPQVTDFTGEGDNGPFSILVLGIPGAYFVTAPEFDDEGAFTSLSDAVAWTAGNYEPFLTA